MTRAARHGMAWLSGCSAVLAVVVFPAAGQAQLANELQPIDITDFQVAPSTTQAGGNPETRILMRFCGFGVPIVDASNTTPIVITIPADAVMSVRGNRGSDPPRAWETRPRTGLDDDTVIRGWRARPDELILEGSSATAPMFRTGVPRHLPRRLPDARVPQVTAPGQGLHHRVLAPQRPRRSDGAAPACPTHLWHASACPAPSGRWVVCHPDSAQATVRRPSCRSRA